MADGGRERDREYAPQDWSEEQRARVSGQGTIHKRGDAHGRRDALSCQPSAYYERHVMALICHFTCIGPRLTLPIELCIAERCSQRLVDRCERGRRRSDAMRYDHSIKVPVRYRMRSFISSYLILNSRHCYYLTLGPCSFFLLQTYRLRSL